jgi:hypothetical protein
VVPKARSNLAIKPVEAPLLPPSHAGPAPDTAASQTLETAVPSTFRNKSRLRDQIVFLEACDARQVPMDARAYRAKAGAARRIVERELGGLSMHDFQFPDLPALQTTAENVYFDGRRCFADVDGSGRALVALATADALIARLRRSR